MLFNISLTSSLHFQTAFTLSIALLIIYTSKLLFLSVIKYYNVALMLYLLLTSSYSELL